MLAKRSLFFVPLVIAIAVVFGTSSDDRPALFPEPDYDIPISENDSALRELGRRLFYDPTLSLDSTVSCASCHQQFSAFAHIDHALSHGVHGRIGTRNVPALQNLAWQTSYMWDGSIEHLDMQALNPITGHAEMSMSLVDLRTRLENNASYKEMFATAYGTSEIAIPRVLQALGRFCASLVSASSRYDRYRAGRDTLSEPELRGLSLFRAKCSVCHTEPLFTDNSYRSNGLPADEELSDSGRIRFTRVDSDLFLFRVPSLRNIEVTQPYMHDGRFKRLRDVLAHYSSSATLADHADPRVRSIGPLRDEERKDIIAFLLTLTDLTFLRDPRHSGS